MCTVLAFMESRALCIHERTMKKSSFEVTDTQVEVSKSNLIQAVVVIDNTPYHTLIYDHFLPLRTYNTILHMASFCTIVTNRIVVIIWEGQDQRTHG